MAGTVLKKRRLVNPGRRRHMTDKQIKFFGTARQKAAMRNRRKRNVAHHGRRRNQGIVSQAKHAAASAIRSVERAAEDAIDAVTGHVSNRGRRRKNVGEIITVIPALGANPGRRRRSMAARTHNRRRAAAHNRRRNRGRAKAHNRRRTVHNRRHRARNPKVVVRYRNRRHNRHYTRGRRRNQGMMAGEMGRLVGVLAGGTVTTLVMRALPANLNTGIMGVVGAAVLAVLQGQVVGRWNKSFGNAMMQGGLLVAAIEAMNQFFPSITLPFSVTGSGTSGMGLLTSSNFYVPQVNVPGSMATFVAPAAIPAPVVLPAGAGMKGLGYPGLRTVRRVGRMR